MRPPRLSTGVDRFLVSSPMLKIKTHLNLLDVQIISQKMESKYDFRQN